MGDCVADCVAGVGLGVAASVAVARADAVGGGVMLGEVEALAVVAFNAHAAPTAASATEPTTRAETARPTTSRARILRWVFARLPSVVMAPRFGLGRGLVL